MPSIIQKAGGGANSVILNSPPPITVEDVFDDEDEDMRELMSPVEAREVVRLAVTTLT